MAARRFGGVEGEDEGNVGNERQRLLTPDSVERGEGIKYRKGSRDWKATSQTEIKRRRNLIICLIPLLTLVSLVLCVSAGAIPNPFSSSPANSSDGDSGNPHVILPTGPDGPFRLPPPTGLPRNEAFITHADHGAVASEDITCSNMGVDVLKEGGNAVDAAIATTLCIGVLNSFSSGIGGGGFMLIRVPKDSSAWSDKHARKTENSSVIAIDFRETGPAAAHEEMYLKIPTASQVGGLSVGVPGELLGLWTAYETYGSGRLSWERLVQPNVELAKGWRVSRELARRFRIFGQFMIGKTEWENVFRPRGDMLVEGDWVQRTNYSRTLEWIGKHGIDGFYGTARREEDNWIAAGIVESIQSDNGIMTRQDLRDYKLNIYPAISSTYHGKTVYTTDAPSSGPVMLGLLNAMEVYDLSPADDDSPRTNATRTPLNIHRLTEALKFAFGARTEISDLAEGFADDARRERIDEFVGKKWGRDVVKNITDDKTHTAEYYNPVFDVPSDSGTTHLSIVDKWGGAVSLTSTVNLIFGSRVMDPVTGIIMNDEMDDFSQKGSENAFGLAPSPYNYPGANKRPLSSTAATIVEYADGSLYTALGGSGGSRIFGAVAQVLLNMEWGMDISAAVEEPRLHDQLFPAMVTLETDFDEDFVKDLKARGHNVTMFDINLGVAEVQAVMVDKDGRITAASDSRKHGVSVGY